MIQVINYSDGASVIAAARELRRKMMYAKSPHKDPFPVKIAKKYPKIKTGEERIDKIAARRGFTLEAYNRGLAIAKAREKAKSAALKAQEPQKIEPPLPPPPPPPATNFDAVSFADIKKEVSEYYQTSLENILGRCRKRRIVMARHMCIYLGRTIFNDKKSSWQFLVSHIGLKDHTSAIHSWQKINGLLKAGDAPTSIAVESIKSRLIGKKGEQI